MEQQTENKPIVNPYLADEQLRAQYPDVDFDQQEAHHSRRNYIINKIHLHGRDKRFLLALIFSDPDAIGCCKTLRNIITDYRQYILDCYRMGVPFERVEIVDVDELRTLVYRYHPGVNTIDMYIKLLNEVDALNRQIASLIADYAKLKKDYDELKEKYEQAMAELSLYRSGKSKPKADTKKPDAAEVLLEQEEKASGEEQAAGEKSPEERVEEAPLVLKLKLVEANKVVMPIVGQNKSVCSSYVNKVVASKDADEAVNIHTLSLLDGGWAVPDDVDSMALARVISGLLPDAHGNGVRTVRDKLHHLYLNWKKKQ